MPAARWTTDEQVEWLQERLPQYMTEHQKGKDYSHFWPMLIADWFKQFPEEAATFPSIPADTLSAGQNAAVDEAKTKHKTFRWHANASKKNRSLKKETTVFDDALQPRRRAKSEAEIYSDMYYDEHIKPLVKAKEEAGNVTSGKRITLGRKFSKELLEDEDEDVKAQIHELYRQQQKTHEKSAKNNILDDDKEGDCMLDAEGIMRGIDDLPLVCRRFAQLIKKKTGFITAFMFAGPDPRIDWDMTLLSCHPSETLQGRNFAQLYQTADKDFLDAFQHYAELIFHKSFSNRLPVDSLRNGAGVLQTDSDVRKDQECDEAFEMDDEEEPKGHDETEDAEQQEGWEDGSAGKMDVRVEGSSVTTSPDDDA
ncbi:hypothetical protein EDD22DRAFT_959397 [Suillus occidentalis]|nr:hypothetical protein EDD22DRAFT_959397 [Suillus occidentalis]